MNKDIPHYYISRRLEIFHELVGSMYQGLFASVGFIAEEGVTKKGIVVYESGKIQDVTLEGLHTMSSAVIAYDKSLYEKGKDRNNT